MYSLLKINTAATFTIGPVLNADGTAYVTDIGMVGPYDGVIGMKKEASLSRFLRAKADRFEVSEGDLQLHGLLIVTEGRKAVSVERVLRRL